MTETDLELLEQHLDGELHSDDQARLKQRLKVEPELAVALTELNAARGASVGSVASDRSRSCISRPADLAHSRRDAESGSTGFR